MPTVQRWVSREVALLHRYGVEVAGQWLAILGSTVVIVLVRLLLVHADLADFVKPVIVDFMPRLAPWLTKNRLTAFSALAAVALAQYIVWRKLRRAVDEDIAYIDRRLEVLEETPRQILPDDEILRKMKAAHGVAPLPDHALFLTVRARATIKKSAILVGCNAPIHHAIALYKNAQSETVMAVPDRQQRRDRVVFVLGDGPLLANSRFVIKVYSRDSIGLKLLEITRRQR